MSKTTKVKDWFISKLKKDKPKNTKHETRYAFTCGGVDYYELADPFKIPPQRGYHLLREWSLMKAKITEEYLQKQTDAVDIILKKDHKNVFDAKTEIRAINEQLKERLKFIAFDFDNLYRVAAVHFFDSNENIDIFDLDYAVKKIESWKKNGTVDNFFLQTPLIRLFPFLENLNENLKNYEEVVNKLNNLHLEKLYPSILKN